MGGEIDTTTKSRRLSLYEILDVNTQVGECPSMVCRNSKLHSHELVTSYLQDFNMVKRESRLQTNKNNTHKMLGKHYGKHETDYSGVCRLA